MGYTTEATVWPTSATLDQSVKDLIGLFYELADNKSKDSGPRMAREIFAENGFMGAATGGFRGSEGKERGNVTSCVTYTMAEISRSRENAWKTVASRHHTVLKVFVNDEAGHELMVLGDLKQVMVNGKELVLPFTGNLVIDAESHATGKPRLRHMQAYAVSACSRS